MNGSRIYNVYDGSGARVHVEKIGSASQTAQRMDYLKAGGMPIARVDLGVDIYYEHSDPLGSPVAVTINWGSIQSRERYTPFGMAMDKPGFLDDHGGFTGHLKDSATGLTYMQARYYDPAMGRFLSIDPVTFMDTGVPEMFNRYAYVGNDPINFTDPTGMVKLGLRLGAEGYFVGGLKFGVEATYDTKTGQVQSKVNFGVGAGIGGGLDDIILVRPSSEETPGTSRSLTVTAEASAVAVGASKEIAKTTDGVKTGPQPTEIGFGAPIVDTAEGGKVNPGLKLSANVNANGEVTKTSGDIRPAVSNFVNSLVGNETPPPQDLEERR